MLQSKIHALHTQRGLTWENSLHVPRDEAVDDGVEEHHEHDARHAEPIVVQRRLGQVVPLDADALFLVPRHVAAAEAERHRRQHALPRDRYGFSSRAQCLRCPTNPKW